MDLPDFEIGAHEHKAAHVHSSEPLCSPATARFKIGNDWYLVRTCREAYQDDPIVFLRLDAPNSPVVNSYWGEGQEDFQERLKTPNVFLSHKHWHRDLVYKTGVFGLTLDTSSSAKWSSETTQGFSRWNFPRDVTLDWLLRDADDAIRHETSKLLEDDSSDCSFSWWWANLDEQERSALGHRTQRGTPSEFVHLIKCIIWHYCLHLMDDNIDRGCIIHLSRPNAAVKTRFQLYKKSLRPQLLPNNGFPPEKALRCFELACSYFSLDYRADWQKYTAIKEEIHRNGIRPIVSPSLPSHHQCLEARLQLRDFLRDKVSSAELAELMQQ